MCRSVDFAAEFMRDVEVVARRRSILTANIQLRALTPPEDRAKLAMEQMRIADEAMRAAYVVLFSEEEYRDTGPGPWGPHSGSSASSEDY